MPKLGKILPLLIGAILSLQTFACDENVDCPKCGEKSEYTWNPSNELVTSRLNRFYVMEKQITVAYQSGDFEKTKSLIDKNLQLARIYRCNWNYGNAIHDSNRILGLISLSEGNISDARKYIVKAGKSTGSPQLNSFGPNLDLANQLLSLGETDAVIEYLEGIKTFWDGNDSLIEEWIAKIRSGETPKLTHYGNAGVFETISIWFSTIWPSILALIFWSRIKSSLSNNWLFPIVAIITGYLAMIAGGLLMRPLLMGVVNITSSNLLVPVIIVLSVSITLGFPLLAIFVVARIFKQRAAQGNG